MSLHWSKSERVEREEREEDCEKEKSLLNFLQ